jgi:hypothetical protein
LANLFLLGCSADKDYRTASREPARIAPVPTEKQWRVYVIRQNVQCKRFDKYDSLIFDSPYIKTPGRSGSAMMRLSISRPFSSIFVLVNALTTSFQINALDQNKFQKPPKISQKSVIFLLHDRPV